MDAAYKNAEAMLRQWALTYLNVDRQVAQYQNPGRETFNRSVVLKVLEKESLQKMVADTLTVHDHLPVVSSWGNRRQQMEAAVRLAAQTLHAEGKAPSPHAEMWEIFRFRDFHQQIMEIDRLQRETPGVTPIDSLSKFQRQGILDYHHALQQASPSFQRASGPAPVIPFPKLQPDHSRS